jgi:hypothetical protein
MPARKDKPHADKSEALSFRTSADNRQWLAGWCDAHAGLTLTEVLEEALREYRSRRKGR